MEKRIRSLNPEKLDDNFVVFKQLESNNREHNKESVILYRPSSGKGRHVLVINGDNIQEEYSLSKKEAIAMTDTDMADWLIPADELDHEAFVWLAYVQLGAASAADFEASEDEAGSSYCIYWEGCYYGYSPSGLVLAEDGTLKIFDSYEDAEDWIEAAETLAPGERVVLEHGQAGTDDYMIWAI